MKHTLSCLARNEPGVLAKIARSFAEEGINIYSLAAGEVEEEAALNTVRPPPDGLRQADAAENSL
jgi:acetolactate synthase-1/3 small subunit